jgi:tRNA-dihydrouridine synthase A
VLSDNKKLGRGDLAVFDEARAHLNDVEEIFEKKALQDSKEFV